LGRPPQKARRPADDTTATGETPGQADEEGEWKFTPFILLLDAPDYGDELRALVEWVEGVLVPGYLAEPSSDPRWCHLGFEPPIAVARLHACWLAWQSSPTVPLAATPAPACGTATNSTPACANARLRRSFAGCVKGEHQIDHRLPGTVPSAWRQPEA
jgi:hypothetical protein